MYSNERNAVIMRRGEKQVLTFFINLAKKAIKLLGMPWRDVKKITSKISYNTEDPIEQYIKTVVCDLVPKSKS